jgi:ABC-2 type transport system permease protein
MNKIFIVAIKDIKEAFASRSTFFSVLITLIIAIPYLQGIKGSLDNLIRSGASEAALQIEAQSLMNNLLYTLPLVLTMIMCSVFSAYAVIMDKTRRSLESLLATPVSMRQMWFGKNLAVALPSVVIALAVTILAYIVISIWVIVPDAGKLIIPSAWPLVSALVIIPVLSFFVVAPVTFLQLILTNPRIASIAFMIIFFGLYFSIFTQLNGSLGFGVIYLAVTAALALITLILSRIISKEKVILSSKG